MQANFDDAVKDEAALRAALADADVVPAMLVHAHLTGETDLLDAAAPFIAGPWNFQETIPEALRAAIRERLIGALRDRAASAARIVSVPAPGMLQRMMSVAVGQSVSSEYIPLLIEEMGFDDTDARALHWRRDPATVANAEFQTVVVGAGLAGVCAAIRLKEAGIPFVVIEKNPTVGGTWFENDYPGCGVDTPNHFFSYSFSPYAGWSHHFSKRHEIWRYVEDTADAYDVRRHIRFETEVIDATFDEDAALWIITTRASDGAIETITANALITAVGQLNRPSIPDIPGLEDFAGPCFHTARWDHSAALEGKRVVMIGTGASGMQAGPSIAPHVAQLSIVQRSPHWAMRNANYHAAVSNGMKWAFAHIPLFASWHRFLLFWASSDGFHASLKRDPAWTQPAVSLNAANHRMREMIVDYVRGELDGDEALLAKVVPPYPPYGKRMLRDNNWYRMLKRPNVDLHCSGVERVTKDAVVLRDGTVLPADVIVMATGFQAAKILWPMRIAGRGGVTIRDVWGDDDPRAYLGMAVPGFPNLFVTFGPNTNLAHGGSAIFFFECQIRWIMQALREMIEGGYATLEVRQSVHDAYNEKVDALCREMVWAHPGVTNWYKNRHNRVTVTTPWRLVDYWALTQTFRPDEFHLARQEAAMAASA